MARKQRKPGWFDQARKGESAFGANVMDPGSNIESEEKIVKSADGTVTKTTVSNKQNTPAFQGMQTEQTQGGVEKETQKSYSPEQISAFDQGNMGAGDEPQAAYSPEQISAFDQSNMGAGDGPQAAYTPEEFEAMRAQAIADSGVETFTRPDGSSAQAIPGSPEAQGLNAMGYAEGGIGAASLLNPGVTGTPVLDTQAQAQEQMIAQQGDQAAQAAFEANSGLGNTAITNQVAADEARVAAEQSVISDFEVANDPTLAQAQVEAQVEVQAKAQAAIDALDEAEANAPDDSGDMGGYDEAQTQAQLDQAIKDTQDRLAAGVDPKSMIDKISEWYGDNPVLAKALIGAVGNYVSTGNMYSALGAGLEGGVGALDSIAAGKAEAATEVAKNAEWDRRQNANFARDLSKLKITASNKAVLAGIKADKDVKEGWGKFTTATAARLGKHWTPEERRDYGIPDQTNAVQQAAIDFQSNYGLANDWYLDNRASTNFEAGLAEWNEHNRSMVDGGNRSGVVKSPISFIESRWTIDNSNLPSELFLGSKPEDVSNAGYKVMNIAKGKGNTITDKDVWKDMHEQFVEQYVVNGRVADDIQERAEDAGMTPFMYWLNILA